MRILPFLVPLLTRGGVIDRRLARLLGSALWMYDLTGGLRIGKRHHRIDVDAALAHMPTLARDRLAGAYVYYDAQADDARLTLTIARTAAAHGAVVANHTAVRGSAEGRRPGRRRAASTADGDEIDVRARVVVNAAGVWADDVRALDEGTHPASIRPAKGIHITVPWEKVRNDIAAIVPVPGDKRIGLRGAVGRHHLRRHHRHRLRRPARRPAVHRPTTSTTCSPRSTASARRSSPRPTSSARGPGCARSCARGAVDPHRPTSRAGTPCGCRPSGVVTVTGGKLTTYRRMAADAVDAALDALGEPSRPGRAPSTCGCSAARASPRRWPRSSPAPTSTSPVATAPRPRSCARSPPTIPTSATPLVPGLPYLRAEARVRGAARDGPHARRRALAPRTRRGCWRATRRPTRPRRSPSCSPPTSAGPRPSATPRSRRTVLSIDAERAQHLVSPRP